MFYTLYFCFSCEVDSAGTAHCVCDNPMFVGEFCDEYACAGHCLNGGMCFPHWDEGRGIQRTTKLISILKSAKIVFTFYLFVNLYIVLGF